MSKKEKFNPAVRARTLIEAADKLQELASDRSRSADSKAGFLAVTAGIVVGGNSLLTYKHFDWWLAALPLLLAMISIVFAVWALKIRPRKITGAVELQTGWLHDDTQTSEALLQLMAMYKARDVGETEAATSARIRWSKLGFYFLIAALGCSMALYVVDNSIR